MYTITSILDLDDVDIHVSLTNEESSLKTVENELSLVLDCPFEPVSNGIKPAG